MSRLRFGTFLAPFHPAGVNPTAAIHRDLRLVQHLDEMGFDEAWIGEHHSAGTEIIASPEIFMAAAAERTKNIKLGTGVVSVSYHNPLCCSTTSRAVGSCSASARARCPPTPR